MGRYGKTQLLSYRETVCRGTGSETEGAGNDRPPHMDVEAKPAFASRDTEIEAAITEMEVPGWAKCIVDGADHLPIGMGSDAKAADIAIGTEPEAVAEVAVIAAADQRIGPAGAAADAYPRQQTGIEPQIGLEPPGAKPGADIGELHRVLEHAPEDDPRAHICVQLGVAALIKYVVGPDSGAHRQVDCVDQEAEGAVANLE